MNKGQLTIQIGKNRLTDGLTEVIKNAFKNRTSIKLVVLKSAGHNKEKTKEIAEQIQEVLGNKYNYRILGFTIFLKKFRKAQR